MKRKLFGLLLLVVLFSACNNESATPIVNTELSPTQTPSITPVSYSTPTSSNSPTAHPTNTPEPTASPTATKLPATQTAISLIDEHWQICAGAMHPSIYDLALSPNKIWLAIECSSNSDLNSITKVYKLDGTQSWDVPFYETAGINLKSSSFPDGIKGGFMRPFHWSKDGNYLYLAPHIYYIDGPWGEFSNGLGLYRLDLITGKVSTTLSNSNAYSFSPNDKYLAYITYDGHLEIWNLLTGEINGRGIGGSSSIGTGMIKWSPDSKLLTYIVAFDVIWNQNGKFVLYLYDTQENTIRIILKPDPRSCMNKEWLSDTKLLLVGASNPDTCHLVYDVLTTTFTPASIATPTP
jgi:WD40 repeat protein